MSRSQILIAAVIVACGQHAALALEPADIAVLFNTRSPTSLQIAQHYMDVRKIPANHLIPLTCETWESISEEQYRTVIMPQVRKALADRKLIPDPKAGIAGVKCLVTTYGVPLKIQGHLTSAAENLEVAGYQKQLEAIVTDLTAQLDAYARVAAPPAATTPATAAAPATTQAKVTWQSVAIKFNTAVSAAAVRIDRLPPEQRPRAMGEFIQLQQHLAGLSGILRSVSIAPGAPDFEAGQKRLQEVQTKLNDLQQQYAALSKQKDSPRMRQEMVLTRLESEGVIGQAQTLEELISYLHPENSEASLDNELALVLADQSYPRANWIINPSSVEAYNAYQHGPGPALQTLMIARLDGSTPMHAMDLIDRAIKTEATGLEGKLYFDARGLNGSDAYSQYDADIRKAAEWMKQHSTIEVVLDNNPELLHARDAPDCAAYCGWYSVRHYIDSCQWVPGAVGYHVASFEMVSLHEAKETGWVVNLLDRGFAGTLGPTDEPFLQSFPKPSLFFPLLMSGEFTQGEVWQVTTPMLSWRQAWVGDPLYNPYKVKPRVKVEDLLSQPLLRNAFAILGHDLPRPATAPATTPATTGR